MELDERPTEQYSDIGGLDKQIEEVCKHLFSLVRENLVFSLSLSLSLSLSPSPSPLMPQLVEAIVLPMTHRERFENIGVHPPKGMYVGHCYTH